ncbi:MAG: type I restriction enzyme HsdR N-terminal domain-containing protein [Duncaniella sp.]|nr:type I restriction enzyme HsdR N-terminal domain-containing protein [Duncaniella sp.]
MPKALDTPAQLNLPPAALSLRHGDKGVEVYDVLRSRWIVLTAEEWVRQHFVHYLMVHLGYRQSLMANEIAITLNGTSRRCDTVVYSAALQPLMIVEYKAPSVAITQRVLDQAARYNVVLRVPYLLLSNGLKHYCFKVDTTPDGSPRCTLVSIPGYDALTAEE